jgi:hypothetical protein
VYTLPELYTLLISNGVSHPTEYDALLKFNVELFRFHLDSEITFNKLASISGKPSVVILDRGVVDNAAYMTEKLFNEVCDTINETRQSLLNRYDIVCHLVSAADGAEEHYTTENNVVRLETADEARELDRNTITAWEGHSRFHVIKNGPGGFEEKLNEVTKIIVDYVGSSL